MFLLRGNANVASQGTSLQRWASFSSFSSALLVEACSDPDLSAYGQLPAAQQIDFHTRRLEMNHSIGRRSIVQTPAFPLQFAHSNRCSSGCLVIASALVFILALLQGVKSHFLGTILLDHRTTQLPRRYDSHTMLFSADLWHLDAVIGCPC
ncbi:hypothetical protein C8F04DRAFT_619269 [Mycena alexandri]|uniref:Uncharacterized protein n=1 Tax=Mycena alexandri TaxID=1745969 RepID=A0AAD6ST28_9AGAR|nr:hypothetical protein C8F04DRAFT_619269 [Mycena alexandri]